MKPIDVKLDSYDEYDVDSNEKVPKFKTGDHVQISKHKNILSKGYTPYWSEGVFVMSEIKKTILWIYVVNDIHGEEIVGTFYEKLL